MQHSTKLVESVIAGLCQPLVLWGKFEEEMKKVWMYTQHNSLVSLSVFLSVLPPMLLRAIHVAQQTWWESGIRLIFGVLRQPATANLPVTTAAEPLWHKPTPQSKRKAQKAITQQTREHNGMPAKKLLLVPTEHQTAAANWQKSWDQEGAMCHWRAQWPALGTTWAGWLHHRQIVDNVISTATRGSNLLTLVQCLLYFCRPENSIPSVLLQLVCQLPKLFEYLRG